MNQYKVAQKLLIDILTNYSKSRTVFLSAKPRCVEAVLSVCLALDQQGVHYVVVPF